MIMIGPNQAGQRLDRFLRKFFKEVPLSHLHKVLREGKVKVNGKREDGKYFLKEGEEVEVSSKFKVQSSKLKTQSQIVGGIKVDKIFFKKNFKVLYEDENLLVLDKPAGLAAHPGTKIPLGKSLIELVWHYLEVEPSSKWRSALAHRLDKETSGVIVAAKNAETLRKLGKLLESKQVKKEYLALVKGKLEKKTGTIEIPLEVKEQARKGEKVSTGKEHLPLIPSLVRRGECPPLNPSLSKGVSFLIPPLIRGGEQGGFKNAITHYSVEKEFPDFSLLKVVLETGRMHQIRVHFAQIGHPVVGDKLYGDFAFNREMEKRGLKRMFLHAWKINLPGVGEVEAEVPEELEKLEL